jgi:hypothetical protein
VLLTIVASVHLYSLGVGHEFGGRMYTEYNNYVIFKNSFFHLIDSKDLYILYPEEQWDLYKYSPTFALAMGSLAYLPDVIGLTIWNLINAVSLFAAIRMLPITDKKISLLLWFIALELLTSLQSSQSNALLAGLLIGAFALLERRKTAMATLLLVAATFIKVYGAIGFALFLFYPDKVKFILWSALWTVLFFFTPLAVLSPQELFAQYQSWARMMGEDQSVSFGFSVMGWLHSWFGLGEVKNIVIGLGILLFFIPLIRYRQYGNLLYRMLFLAFMLVWVIIFNHKAESSTFIIAVTGIAIWYFAHEPVNWRKIVLWVVFIFTCLSPTDLFPPTVRKEIFVPYVIKVVPCIMVWCIVFAELMTVKQRSIPESPDKLSLN